MPAITSTDATVLVTGATGFLGTWTIDILLKRGYSVRAAVRNEAKGKYLLEKFKSYGSKLHLVVIGDYTSIATDSAFDEAVRGVSGIIHTAAPTHLHSAHPDEMSIPAINGVLGVLQSALKHGGDTLKRVVITSSGAAMNQPHIPNEHIDESRWNDDAVRECEQKGKEADPMNSYSASKVRAEKAAWEFVARHKSEIKWDLTVIIPPYMFGPPIHEVNSLETLNFSLGFWYAAMLQKNYFGQDPENFPGHGFLDVRDGAEAHVRALEKAAAGGERILVCARAPWVWNDFIDAINGKQLEQRTGGNHFINAKEQKLLGIKYITMEQSGKDILAFMAAKGWK
ncbi:hypothetical protein D9757_014544 [Collybiopsis confluens]|uniref:NAD-dependent epimerase/dehydratase domain-containing protein n=1 Tax=Collybiopsis confluens TaxID=2823264 RepID=A0A8H5FL68_9AGAR|nr:hypothetical protein D9757_014544 [Collybiopsis confluens]